MIFHSVTLENLFSYHGSHSFDLSGVEAGRNIALIAGRNGYGKTSFLNAIKLLFGGITKELREAVQRARTPTERQYVLGAGEDWWGLLNRKAWLAGQRRCAVRVRWREEGGFVEVERAWEIENDDYRQILRIQAEFLEQALEDAAAQEFLDFRLPAEFIKFFIFDGEQVQAIAEANRETQVREIEALLNIGKLGILKEALRAAGNYWQEAALDTSRASELQRLQAELAKTEADKAATAQARELIEQERELLEREIAQLKKRQESRRAAANQVSEALIKERLEKAEEEHAGLAIEVAERLPRVAPLLLAPEIAEKAIKLLERQLKQGDDASSRLRYLANSLPGLVFDAPPLPPIPPLQADQDGYYRNRLRKLLEAEVGEPAEGDRSIDRLRAEKARNLLGRYGRNDDLRRDMAEKLSRLWALESERKRLEQQRRDATSDSQAEREAYARAEEELKTKEGQLVDIKVKLRQCQNDLERLAVLEQTLARQIETQRHEVELSEEARRRLKLAQRLNRFFDAYRSRLKESSRADLEAAINRRYQQLMTSNSLIERIVVDEFFALHYLGSDGKPVGMGGLSAGTKQIAATALLWALKDCSGKTLPVIVDTPLARIDRGNQERLLTAYYPNAAEQVIVLPTDSELDEAKYRLLSPHIYQEYVLHNPSGKDTEVMHQPMYPIREAARA